MPSSPLKNPQNTKPDRFQRCCVTDGSTHQWRHTSHFFEGRWYCDFHDPRVSDNTSSSHIGQEAEHKAYDVDLSTPIGGAPPASLASESSDAVEL